jgi:hypothetical protein
LKKLIDSQKLEDFQTLDSLVNFLNIIPTKKKNVNHFKSNTKVFLALRHKNTITKIVKSVKNHLKIFSVEGVDLDCYSYGGDPKKQKFSEL